MKIKQLENIYKKSLSYGNINEIENTIFYIIIKYYSIIVCKILRDDPLYDYWEDIVSDLCELFFKKNPDYIDQVAKSSIPFYDFKKDLNNFFKKNYRNIYRKYKRHKVRVLNFSELPIENIDDGDNFSEEDYIYAYFFHNSDLYYDEFYEDPYCNLYDVKLKLRIIDHFVKTNFSPIQYSVFCDYFYNELSYSEISKKYGIYETTLRTWIKRIRDTIKQTFKNFI
ncbi:MAG: hypothetical protein KatS3mg129_0968 [Leptospiraceae bacterium]|nr:MAG: hypothetical protein KatS3mg129_0968 [Leptospiraceae bacterium]